VRLRFTEPALADLDAILTHIAEASPQGAQRVRRRLQDMLDLLSQYPSIGNRTNDPTIRRINITPYPYLIFYEPTDDEVIVHAIRHGARNPSSMPGSA